MSRLVRTLRERRGAPRRPLSESPSDREQVDGGTEELVSGWNNVGIVRGFLRFLRRRLAEIRLGSDEQSVGSIGELGEAFADGWLGFGDQILIRGRLSRFSPLYFPVAYSPQIPGTVSGPVVLMQTVFLGNPAPGAMGLRHVDGGVLTFMFPLDVSGTPRITSPDHMDRLVTADNPGGVPYSRATPSIPVLLDHRQLKWIDDKVELRARLRPLHSEIQTELEASREDFVRLYYHGFFRGDWLPDHGFMLDARTATGGTLRQVGDPSPFLVSLAVETAFESSLSKPEIEEAFNATLDGLTLPEISEGKTGSRANYTPAYLTPTGYEVLQVNRLPLAFHLAHEKRVIQMSVVAQAHGRLDEGGPLLCGAGSALVRELRRRDPEIVLEPLFSSDSYFPQQMGIGSSPG